MLIVTDGAVDLPDRYQSRGDAASAGVRIVPGEVWVGEEQFFGSHEEFWAMLRRGTFPSSSPPTVSALVEAYGGTDLVCAVHVSSELSATVARATEAAARATSPVRVIDTRSLSVGAGLIAAAVSSGLVVSRGSVIDYALSLPGRLHTFVLVQEIESLRRSDRAGLLPRNHLARNHPLVMAIRGRAVPLDQPKDRGHAVKRLIDHVRHSVDGPTFSWALGHGDASDHDRVTDLLTKSLGQPPAFVVSIDPTVGAHVGPEAVVVGVLSGVGGL